MSIYKHNCRILLIDSGCHVLPSLPIFLWQFNGPYLQILLNVIRRTQLKYKNNTLKFIKIDRCCKGVNGCSAGHLMDIVNIICNLYWFYHTQIILTKLLIAWDLFICRVKAKYLWVISKKRLSHLLHLLIQLYDK